MNLSGAYRLLRRKPTLTTLQVASELGYKSEAGFRADFKAWTGFTPMDYRRARRHELACRLLRMTDEKLTFLALYCGHADSSAFSVDFRKHEGMPPSEYRRKHR